MHRTFIEEARRKQLIEAAIEVLNEVGYAQTSLAKIAKRAGVSTSLTLYHFKDKKTLMLEALTMIYGGLTAHSAKHLAIANTARQRLHTYIEVNLAYMGTRPSYFGAMIELLFNGRDLGVGTPYREANDDPLFKQLVLLLEDGQKSGEFKKFDVHLMAIMIRGVIDQFLGHAIAEPDLNLEAYTDQVIEAFEKILIKKEAKK